MGKRKRLLHLSFSYHGEGKSFPEASSRLSFRFCWPRLGHTDKLITGIEGDAKSIMAHPWFIGRGEAPLTHEQNWGSASTVGKGSQHHLPQGLVPGSALQSCFAPASWFLPSFPRHALSFFLSWDSNSTPSPVFSFFLTHNHYHNDNDDLYPWLKRERVFLFIH